MNRDAALLDRARGVLLGAACGDALGAPYEFGTARLAPGQRPAMIGGGLGGFAPGEWTDDTAQTYAVAQAAAAHGDLREDAALDQVAHGFGRWFHGNPPDVGIQTRTVLRQVGPDARASELAGVARALHERTGHTAGNGSLMRTSPVALRHLDDPDALAEAAQAVSALTHGDPLAHEACVLWCLAIRQAVLTGELPDPRDGLDRLPEDRRDFWRERLDEAEAQEPASFRPNGFVVTALQAAWSAIAHTRAEGLVAGIEAAIHIGDDTDTVASIAGALLGAVHGASSIPERWRQDVHGWPGARAEHLMELADRAVAQRRRSPSATGRPA
ncbi:ADP-ribosylglycohydrolase family protein [Antribacter gilvus]|uniref:ADP-ribosylglycohydrolase family protein n=1 Tax=Antribacter gilvus TaxID=2304675 RepID=UPI001F0C8AE4|nr:ADP-ribosylglycohydrolase family protein [Antribacter gilvus]